MKRLPAAAARAGDLPYFAPPDERTVYLEALRKEFTGALHDGVIEEFINARGSMDVLGETLVSSASVAPEADEARTERPTGKDGVCVTPSTTGLLAPVPWLAQAVGIRDLGGWSSSGERLTLGKMIAKARRRKGWPQRDLAAMLDKSESWMSQVERDVIPVNSLDTLRHICDVLDVPLPELLGAAPPPEPPAAPWPGPETGRRFNVSGHTQDNTRPHAAPWGHR